MRKFEKLQTAQLDYARKLVKATFPKFTRWKAINKDDEDHFGPCIWGELELNGDTRDPRRFYVTLNHYDGKWRGDLTIGQHAYMWSSADFGDAYLASTEAFASPEEAIAALKSQISSLFSALLTGSTS